jgi:hypothetical protein
MQITTIGLDIAKHVFQVHSIDAEEKVVVRKRSDARNRAGAHGGSEEGDRFRSLLYSHNRRGSPVANFLRVCRQCDGSIEDDACYRGRRPCDASPRVETESCPCGSGKTEKRAATCSEL